LFNELPESVPLNVAAEIVPLAEMEPVEEILPVESVPLILTFWAPAVKDSKQTRQNATDKKQVLLTGTADNGCSISTLREGRHFFMFRCLWNT
jgi:hypothetical protein